MRLEAKRRVNHTSIILTCLILFTCSSSQKKGRDNTTRKTSVDSGIVDYKNIQYKTPPYPINLLNVVSTIPYPEEFRRQGIHGTIDVEILIEETGIISEIDIVESLHPVLDSIAKKKTKELIFIPSLMNGIIPTDVRIRFPFKFKLLEYDYYKEK